MRTIEMHAECEGCGELLCMAMIFVTEPPAPGMREVCCPACGDTREKYFRYLGNEVIYEW